MQQRQSTLATIHLQTHSNLGVNHDPGSIPLCSALDEIVHQRVQSMLPQAIKVEVAWYFSMHDHLLDAYGHRLEEMLGIIGG